MTGETFVFYARFLFTLVSHPLCTSHSIHWFLPTNSMMQEKRENFTDYTSGRGFEVSVVVEERVNTQTVAIRSKPNERLV